MIEQQNIIHQQQLFCPAFNKTINFPLHPKRIISLVPSQTELLFDLGLNDEVIGITKFCIHPTEWFTTKTRIGGTKNVDIQKITSLHPDLIIANKEENVQDQIEALESIAPVWLTDVNTLEDAIQMIEIIGMLTSTSSQAQVISQQIKNQFANLTPKKLVSACYLIWQNPYMTIGADTFINNMLQKAGFQNIFEDRLRYPTITIQEIKDLNPAFVFLSSEPYPFKQKHIHELQLQLPNSTIMLVDGEMFSWYGSRLLKTTAYLNKLMDVCIP